MNDKTTEPQVPSFVGPQNLRVSEHASQGTLMGMATCERHQELSPGHLGCGITGEDSAIWLSLQARPEVVSLPATVPLGPSSKIQAYKARKQALAHARAITVVTPQESAPGQRGLVKPVVRPVAVCDESVVRGDCSDRRSHWQTLSVDVHAGKRRLCDTSSGDT